MEKLELYKDYRDRISKFEKSLEKIRTNRETKNQYVCDKHIEGFVTNPSPYGGIRLKIGGFESFSGSFGSSSVYSDINGDSFESQCMTEAINNLRDDILVETLEIMKKKAAEIKEDALKEYEFLINDLNEN